MKMVCSRKSTCMSHQKHIYKGFCHGFVIAKYSRIKSILRELVKLTATYA